MTQATHTAHPLLTALLALLLSAACSESVSDVPASGVQPVPMAFSARIADITTRAAGGGELTDALLKAQGFGVYCWYTGSDAFTTPLPTTARTGSTQPYELLMRNQQVVWDAVLPQPQWVYSPTKYWPQDPNEKLTFRAYAPYASYLVTDASTGMPQLPVVVAADDYHNNTQHDPLWGTGVTDAADTRYGEHYTDMTYTTSSHRTTPGLTADDTADGYIHWYFHHGMAKIVFRGLLDAESNDESVTITSISLTPLYNQGLLDLSSPTASATDKPTWDERSGSMEVTLLGTDLADATIRRIDKGGWTQLTTDDRGLLIIPRDFSGTNTPLTLTVTFTTPDGREVVMATDITEHLRGNTVYTFSMTVSNALSVAIQSVNAAFTPWAEQTDDHELYNW